MTGGGGQVGGGWGKLVLYRRKEKGGEGRNHGLPVITPETQARQRVWAEISASSCTKGQREAP